MCEGRIQGPPRGYKEGPHCAPPMQAVPNDHVCEENNYLCNRYRVLIQDITERLAIGSYLCVEVLLCSDCPCGLTKSTCKYPVYPVPSLPISPWQKCSSEMLLEYWCICVVPSKSQEPMNFQGLYQAVRSRLHFSQVAAWWSRSNGAEPSYIATRIVSHNEDNLSKFRETSVEHTFPLAGNGDGNSIKVTMWALPRMEEVPILTCSLHPKKEKDEEDIARALTPTKSTPMGSGSGQNPEGLVLPVLVDDRLQTTCNKSGKHDCRCEEEDASPLSPTIRSNGERKRRRSLPCGPAESPCVISQPAPLPSVQEYAPQEIRDNTSSSLMRGSAEMANNNRSVMRTLQNKLENKNEVRTHNNRNSDLERCFKIHLKIEELEGNLEKRCKHTMTEVAEMTNSKNVDRIEEGYNSPAKNSANFGREPGASSDIISAAKSGGILHNLSPFTPTSWSFVSSWQNSNMNSKFQSFRGAKEARFNDSEKNYKPPAVTSNHAPINPYAQPNPFHESNPGPSTFDKWAQKMMDNSACIVHQSYPKNVHKIVAEAQVSAGQDALEINKEDSIKSGQRKTGKPDLNHLMWKLSVPDEKEKREEGGLLDWFSKVPGRVLGVAATKGYVDVNKMKNENSLKQPEQSTNEIKFKNCNLELSQREVDEVLAVLRARTPSGRRRATVKNVRKRGERSERGSDDAAEKITARCTSWEEGIVRSNSTSRHVGTVRFRTLKSCEDCSRGLCKKIDHQVPEEQPSPLDRVYYDKNVYRPARSKLAESANKLNEDPQAKTHASEDADRLRNVSTKADVLLGAILRTSKDRKDLSDISSNGTRPRSTTSIDDDSSEEDSHFSSTEKLDQQDHRTISSGDEKSLPLNKRFHRLRQMFKKEVDKRIALIGEESSSSPETTSPSPTLPQRFNAASFRYNNEQPNLHSARYSKTKRRIDFANFPVATEEKEDAATFSTKDAHQKPRNTHSTNNNDRECDTEGLNNQQNHCERLLLEDKEEPFESKEQDENAKDIAALQKNNLITPTNPQSGHSSSKLRSNNYKDSISETGDDEAVDKSVPSALEQERFRRSLENAASMVFHSRTGLPLTSSPAPLRRGSCCFDYDSSLNSVSSKRNALFELNTPPSPGAVSLEETDRDAEIIGEGEETPKRRSSSRHRPQSHALLGSFEESALNGRLEPVSTVHGFTAELGASGSFCPKHQKLPVTVFFYTLGDNDKVSTPYLAHINLEKKGYQVPRSGTVQVTLLNPLGTVVKMFVVLYDLTDMPPRSHTFLRQRTLRDKTLRYLVHLRFMSSKSGRIYLHTDIRMIICRKSDVDTASDLGSESPKELRSYIHGPTNPKFSPRC